MSLAPEAELGTEAQSVLKRQTGHPTTAVSKNNDEGVRELPFGVQLPPDVLLARHIAKEEGWETMPAGPAGPGANRLLRACLSVINWQAKAVPSDCLSTAVPTLPS